MRRVALFLLFLLVFAPCARAETAERIMNGLDLSGVQSWSDDKGADIDVREMARRLMKGETDVDIDALYAEILSRIRAEFLELGGLLLTLLLPMLIWALIQRLSDGEQKGAQAAAGYVCYLSAAGALIYAYARQLELASGAILSIQGLTDKIFPILTTLLVASGAQAAAAVFTPAAALIGGAAISALYRFVFVLIGCAAALVIAGNMNEKMPLHGMSRLFLSVSNWLMGIAMSAFLGFVTVEGVLSSGYDGITVRTARYTVDSLLPIIGGEVADTMEIALKSVVAVKNAVGVTGMLLVLSICFVPVIKMVVAIVALKLASAFIEPLADGGITQLVRQFSSVLVAALVALVAAVVIFLSLVGAMLSAGRLIAG